MLDEYWEKHYGDEPPIAHRLRNVFGDRWVRFHSLPDSKRYADTDSEWTELLGRSNSVLSHLATDDSQLVLLTTSWSESRAPAAPLVDVRKLHLSVEHWRTIARHELDGATSPNFWHVFRSTINWVPGAIDGVIRLVADGCLSNVMVLDVTNSWLFHPYDGGVDVILGSTEERDQLSAGFDSWRSKRLDGL